MRIGIVCAQCGGIDVFRDAWASWDREQQEWVLASVFDYAFCETCEGETELTEVPQLRVS